MKIEAKKNPELELSVVLPCYNEANTIESFIDEWTTFLSEEIANFEFIIVNDGSRDGTGRILDRIRARNSRIRVIHQLNLGTQSATRRGTEAARGKFVLVTHANGRYKPTDLMPFWEKRYNYPMVAGYWSHRLDSWWRRFLSNRLNSISKLLFGSELKELLVPFNLYQTKILRRVMNDVPTTSTIPQLSIALLMEKQFKIAQQAVPYRLSPTIRVRRKHQGPLSVAFQSMSEMLRLRFGAPAANQSKVTHLKPDSAF